MYFIGEFFDMLFAKCETRGQQLSLVLGMAVIVAACAGGAVFFLGLGEAGLETVEQAREMGLRVRRRSGASQATLLGYGGVAVCGIIGLLCGAIGVVNLLRFITGTGLKDPDSSW